MSANASTSETAVFMLIPSPKKYQVKKANDVMPIEKPINRPGQRAPS